MSTPADQVASLGAAPDAQAGEVATLGPAPNPADQVAEVGGVPPDGRKKGFWSDFGEATGGVSGLVTAPFRESIPANLAKLAVHHPEEFGQGFVSAGGLASPVQGAVASISGMVARRVGDFLASHDATDLPEKARQAFKDTVKMAWDRPGLAIGSVIKGALADPELFFLPGALQTRAGLAAADVAKTAGAGARAAEIAGAVTGRATGAVTGATIGGGASAISDMAEDRPLDIGNIEVGAGLGALAGAAAQVRRAPEIRPMTIEEVDRVLGPAMATSSAPKAEVVPTAKGYLVRMEGQTESAHYSTKAEAEAAKGQLERVATGYRAMGAVPPTSDSPAGARAKLLHENPFNQESIVTYPHERVEEAGNRLANFLKKAALPAAIGAGVGYWLDKDDPALAAGFGAALGLVPKLLAKDKRISVENGINLRNGLVAVMARHALQLKSSIETLVPESMRRNQISLWLENPEGIELNANELRAAKAAQKNFEMIGNTAVDAGLIKELLHNYVTHIVEADPEHVSRGTTAEMIEKIVDILTGREERPTGASGRQFAQHRRYATFGELSKALVGTGLRVKTGDIAEISAIYSQAMFKAITDKRLLEALKQSPVEGMPPLVRPKTSPATPPTSPESFRIPPGRPPGEAAQRFAQRQRMLVQPSDQADSSYVSMPGRMLAGYVVHRDIAPQLNFVFNAKDPNDVTLGLMALNQASKRAIVSFSAFHAKSLSDAYIGAMAGEGAVTDLAKMATGQHASTMVDHALAQYRYGGSNDGIDDLLMHGLVLQSPEDFKPEGMQKAALGRIAAVIDRYLPVSATSKAANTIAKFNDTLDHMTFAYLQTGYKLVTGLDAYERLLKKGVPKKAAATMAASYTNDLYGSLDWFRVANDVGSRLGRDVAYMFFQPNGRRLMQLFMFAPDWTFSTFRAAYKALPGATDDPALAALHRRYMMKSALYYLTVANAINLVTAGHTIFSNSNPTRIQLADGRTMQWSKHFMEPFEWLKDPLQTLGNKMAFLPRETIEEITGKEYISAHDASPDIQNRADHIAAQFLPIPAQQGMAGGGNLSLMGVIGMPVYGKTPEQRRESMIDKRRADYEKKKKRAEFYRQKR